MSEYDNPGFSILQHKIITKVEGLEKGSESVVFTLSNGDRYEMYHSQDCCESVQVEDICGEVEDLIGRPLLQAEESTSDDAALFGKREYAPESFTWTFYRLTTARGQVVIRWLGESNGYYGEVACFRKMS